MRIGLAVDSSCDLPDNYFSDYGVHIMPVTVCVGDRKLIDRRDRQETLGFYKNDLVSRGTGAETQPFSVERIRELFLNQLVIDYDYVFCITVTKERSRIYENTLKASDSILRDYRKIRNAAGVDGPFALRVVDSKSLFSGTGLIAATVVRAIRNNSAANDIRLLIEGLTDHVEAYFIPDDVYYIRTRGVQRGEQSVSAIQALMAQHLNLRPVISCERASTQRVARVRGYENAAERLFEYAIRHIQAGLRAPFICLSYGGDSNEIANLPGYEDLASAAKSSNVELLTSIMSITGAVNAGPRGLTLALVGEHKLPFKP